MLERWCFPSAKKFVHPCISTGYQRGIYCPGIALSRLARFCSYTTYEQLSVVVMGRHCPYPTTLGSENTADPTSVAILNFSYSWGVFTRSCDASQGCAWSSSYLNHQKPLHLYGEVWPRDNRLNTIQLLQPTAYKKPGKRADCSSMLCRGFCGVSLLPICLLAPALGIYFHWLSSLSSYPSFLSAVFHLTSSIL